MPLNAAEKNMDYLRQVIVVRKDLAMPHGKIAAMVAHASMTFLVEAIRKAPDVQEFDAGYRQVTFGLPGNQYQWLTELDPGLEDKGQVSFAKIVVEVPNELALRETCLLAAMYELEFHKVYDAGYSHNPAGTLTCVAIGPDWPDKLRPVTGSLKVYR